MTFGSRLRAARKAKQLTQKELAAKIKAAHNSISNWENNQNMPDPDTIQHLCWALDVQPNYFFSVENDETPVDSGKRSDKIANQNIIRIAGRDGSYSEKVLTDKQLDLVKALIDQLPEVTDL